MPEISTAREDGLAAFLERPVVQGEHHSVAVPIETCEGADEERVVYGGAREADEAVVTPFDTDRLPTALLCVDACADRQALVGVQEIIAALDLDAVEEVEDRRQGRTLSGFVGTIDHVEVRTPWDSGPEVDRLVGEPAVAGEIEA